MGGKADIIESQPADEVHDFEPALRVVDSHAAELEEVVITDPRSGFTRLPVKAASAMLKT